jgi:ABC-type transporter Mla subunit MlaD
MTPYELRYAILQTAKDLVENQYKAANAAFELLDKTNQNAEKLAPKVPTVAEVIEAAIEFNKFVSDANERELIKTVKRVSGISVAF